MSRENVVITVRAIPRIVSRFKDTDPTYEEIKPLLRRHNILTWLVCLFIPSTEVKMPPELCGWSDGVSGFGIGSATKFRGKWYDLSPEQPIE